MIKKPEDDGIMDLSNLGKKGKTIEVDGFKFDLSLINDPVLLMFAMIAIDPTPLQKELLEKFEVVFTDVDGKQVFPRVEEDDTEQ
jgi:hypothetical protein